MLHRTTQGRVVYDRKKHYMSLKDATRILARVRGAFSQFSFYEILAFYREVLLDIQKTAPDFIYLAGTLDIKEFNDASLIIFSLLWDIASRALEIDARAYKEWIKTQVPQEAE